MTEVELESLGWTVHGLRSTWRCWPARRACRLEPDVRLQIGAADHFAGRDPVLATAIALP